MSEQKPELGTEVKKQPSNEKTKKEAVSKKRVEGLKRFFVETKAEFKKIVWPTPKQVVNNTIVVLVTILIVGAVIWILDALTSNGLNILLNKIAG